MMISPTGASDVYVAAAALDRQLRSSSDDAGDATSPGDAGPDVVVTLGQGASMPATYDASGRLSGAPTLDDLGANRPDSLARATEVVAGDSDDGGADAGASDAMAGSDAAPGVMPEAATAPA